MKIAGRVGSNAASLKEIRCPVERIADFLDTGATRSRYRAAFLRNASGTKKVNAWTREIDPATNAF